VFDVAVGQVWHWAEGMDYYVVSAEIVKGQDIGLRVPNEPLSSGPPPARPTAQLPFAGGVRVGRIPGEL